MLVGGPETMAILGSINIVKLLLPRSGPSVASAVFIAKISIPYFAASFFNNPNFILLLELFLITILPLGKYSPSILKLSLAHHAFTLFSNNLPTK